MLKFKDTLYNQTKIKDHLKVQKYTHLSTQRLIPQESQTTYTLQVCSFSIIILLSSTVTTKLKAYPSLTVAKMTVHIALGKVTFCECFIRDVREKIYTAKTKTYTLCGVPVVRH